MAEPLRKVHLTLLPHRKPLAVGRDRVLVLCRITNDATSADERRPVQLMVALDRSGSMEGSKLAHAISTLKALIDELGPEDKLGILIFDDVIDIIMQPTLMSSSAKGLARSALDTVKARNGTDICGAVLHALSLSKTFGEEPAHVIALTDGAPTAGITQDDQILKMISGAIDKSTLSTFGYGTDVRPELLGQLADLGTGGYHFIEGNEPPHAAFARELGGQRAIMAVDTRLQLALGRGVRLTSWPLSTRLLSQSNTTGVVLGLAALTCGDAVPILLGLELDSEAHDVQTTTPWLKATLSYRDISDAQQYDVVAEFVPLLADDNGPYQAEVAREIVIERAAKAIHRATPDQASDLKHTLESLRAFAHKAGVHGEPQVTAALDLVAQTIEGLASEVTRGHTMTQASAIARGMSKRKATITGFTMSAFDDERSRVLESKLKKNDPNDPDDSKN